MSKTYSPNFPLPQAPSTKTQAPYGNWKSTFSSERLSAKSIRLNEPQLDGNYCYWIEQRPEEKGRGVIVRQALDNPSSPPEDTTPETINVYTRIQEYGGGSYLVHNGVLYAVNAEDQRIYKIDIDNQSTPIAISPKGNYRYADFYVDEKRQQLICICEIYREGKEPESNIVSLKLDGSSTMGLNILIFGNSFYSNPRVSPDGEKLSWLTWKHPYMPWDNSECWLADFNSSGMLHKHRKVAGGIYNKDGKEQGESIFQPMWSPTGDLLFVSDRNNWWNLYTYNTYNKHIECLLEMEAEFATPQWVFGMSTYGFLNSYTLLCTYTQNGSWFLASIDLMSHQLKKIDTPFNHIEYIHCDDNNDNAVFLASSSISNSELIYWENNQWRSIAKSSDATYKEEDIARAHPVHFKNSEQQDVHGFFYHPTNGQFFADKDEKPPLIVICHSGPTSSTSSALNNKVQFWTSRGFAVFDVNYSGSTGYGRDYRRRLYKKWGVKEIDDIVCGVNNLIKKDWVNPEKIAIRGSSAGGYSVLAALCFSDIFKAGTSLYGIGDLTALAEDTHKFESHYCDQLIGKYPDEKSVYNERSPINHVKQLNCPVLFIQGLEDKVVPPSQAETMVNALHTKNIPVAYITFSEEGHGFRQAKNIRYAFDAEYAFYAKLFDLQPQEYLPDIPFYSGKNTLAGND